MKPKYIFTSMFIFVSVLMAELRFIDFNWIMILTDFILLGYLISSWEDIAYGEIRGVIVTKRHYFRWLFQIGLCLLFLYVIYLIAISFSHVFQMQNPSFEMPITDKVVFYTMFIVAGFTICRAGFDATKRFLKGE